MLNVEQVSNLVWLTASRLGLDLPGKVDVYLATLSSDSLREVYERLAVIM